MEGKKKITTQRRSKGGQLFDNCSVKTDEAVANRRRAVTPRHYTRFCIQSLRRPSAISFTWPSGSQWPVHKGMIGSPPINRGLQGKSDSCAGFYREDEWVNR